VKKRKFFHAPFLHNVELHSRMPRHSCCEVRVMQLHDILLLRTSAIMPEAISAGSHLPADIDLQMRTGCFYMSLEL